jgi:hypothetical protein
MATVKDRKQLKKLTESAAKKDAVRRSKRRGQL